MMSQIRPPPPFYKLTIFGQIPKIIGTFLLTDSQAPSSQVGDISIDVLCLQEVEIPANVASEILNIDGYNLELETNSVKSRTCVYIANKIKYKRKSNLEGIDSNIVIIDFEGGGDVSRLLK